MMTSSSKMPGSRVQNASLARVARAPPRTTAGCSPSTADLPQFAFSSSSSSTTAGGHGCRRGGFVGAVGRRGPKDGARGRMLGRRAFPGSLDAGLVLLGDRLEELVDSVLPAHALLLPPSPRLRVEAQAACRREFGRFFGLLGASRPRVRTPKPTRPPSSPDKIKSPPGSSQRSPACCEMSRVRHCAQVRVRRSRVFVAPNRRTPRGMADGGHQPR